MTKHTKLFVLDTNVLMHDPMCMYQFDEHDVFIPMRVLEELDKHKKGMEERNLNARKASREFDKLISGFGNDIGDGVPLPHKGTASAGKLFFQTKPHGGILPELLNGGTADNDIIAVAKWLKEEYKKRTVVLVSKDINMRIKARLVDITTGDYTRDKVFEDADVLPRGIHHVTHEEFETLLSGGARTGTTRDCEIRPPSTFPLRVNEFIVVGAETDAQRIFTVRHCTDDSVALKVCTSFRSDEHKVFGIKARNAEQACALNLLTNPDIDLVVVLGPAGTGKTLLTLAAGLSEMYDKNTYNEIIITRVTIPIGEDIGFLPGTEEEKMDPWMGAVTDNLEVLLGTSKKPGKKQQHHSKNGDDDGGLGVSATKDFIQNRVKIRSLNFMRGRTFLGKYLVIDEAQNLTPKQMKALVTRAGNGTKVVCLGNLAQIDTPYLTEGTSGLSYAAMRFRGWQHYGSVILSKGERSRLADYANGVM